MVHLALFLGGRLLPTAVAAMPDRGRARARRRARGAAASPLHDAFDQTVDSSDGGGGLGIGSGAAPSGEPTPGFLMHGDIETELIDHWARVHRSGMLDSDADQLLGADQPGRLDRTSPSVELRVDEEDARRVVRSPGAASVGSCGRSVDGSTSAVVRGARARAGFGHVVFGRGVDCDGCGRDGCC